MAETAGGPPRPRESAVERRILAAATRLFAERGFDGTSVQEVVDAAQVTKGALYHYFESKNDLLYEIYHSLLSRQLADLDRVVAQSLPPAAALRALIGELVETTAARIDETKVWVREMYRLDDAHMLSVRAERRRYHVTFRRIIEDAQAAGAFARTATPETVTLIVLGMVNEMPKWYRQGGPKTPGELAAEVSSFVLAALEPRGPSGG